MLSLLLRGGRAAETPPVKFYYVTAPGWTGGNGSLSSPLAGPATSDVSFTAVVGGTLYWSGFIGDGQANYAWTAKKNGSVVSSGSGTQSNGSVSVSPGDVVRIEATGAEFFVGNLQVYIA